MKLNTDAADALSKYHYKIAHELYDEHNVLDSVLWDLRDQHHKELEIKLSKIYGHTLSSYEIGELELQYNHASDLNKASHDVFKKNH